MGIFDNLKTLTQIRPAPQSPAAPVASPAAKKILIVEDEKMLADALQLKLKNEGFTVFVAENGQAGLETVQTQKPDLILLDLMMPVMDGKTMLLRLRQIPEFVNTPVIVLTNAGDLDNMRQTQLYYNVKKFLIKSNISMAEIAGQVREIIFPESTPPAAA